MAVAHFIFSPSAAGSLRQALKEAKRDETVTAFYDDLSFGPIAPPASNLRCAWVDENLHLSDWEDVTMTSEKFWSELATTKNKPTIWLSRRASNEYAGFLACLDHIGTRECDFIDITDTKIVWIDKAGTERTQSSILGTGMLSADEILRNGLLDRARKLSSEELRTYLTAWRRLQAENASIRIVGREGLESAPMTHFDDMLLSYASSDWQKIALIVGHGLAHQMDDNIRQVGDIVLGARVWTLIDQGKLEARGGLTSMHDTDVRLAQ